IEGRMKSPEYVATVVRVYRNALDRIRDGTWKPRPADLRDLLLAFNRGFTTGHLGGVSRRTLVGSERQDHRGFPIGKVLSCDTESGQLRIRLSGDQLPAQGDGLHVFLSGRDGTDCGWEMMSPPEVRGTTLLILCREPVPPGAQVSITRSGALDREIRRTMKAITPVPSRRIPVDLDVVWEEGTPRFHGTVHLHDGRIIPVSYDSPVVMEPAVKHPLTFDEIAAQLCRTGGTPFTMSKCQLRYPGGLFAVPSQMNRMRREFLSAVETALVSARRPSRAACAVVHEHLNEAFPSEEKDERLHSPLPPTSLTLTTYVSDLSGLRAAIEGGSDRICLDMDPESMEEILGGINDLHLTSSLSLVWKWPRITTDATIAAALPILPRLAARGINEIMVDSPGAARALREHAPVFSRAGSSGLNVWNHHTVAAYAPLFSSLTLSPELSLAQMQDLLMTVGTPRPRCEVMVQGNLEVMISENCFFQGRDGCGRSPCSPACTGTRWGLIDQMDRFFPLEVDRACRIHLFNAVETCSIDHLTELRRIGIDRIVIDARFRSPRYIREMVSLYREALGHLHDHSKIARKDMSGLKEEIRKRTRGGITHGPLLTGLREPQDGETR
ncbi:MAG: DUF3656 domain-containing protein, partial [Methanomicrobiales archaeon]|nr:DUF3656 domain-containing protein [Methanomicrobiales archaeon]